MTPTTADDKATPVDPAAKGLPCVCLFGGQTADGRFDEDMPVQECDLHKALRARVAELTRALSGLVEALDDLIGESHGVDGLHLNGDVAPWDSLLPGGEYETWLQAIDPARNVLAAMPAQAMERARAVEEVVKWAQRLIGEAHWIPAEECDLDGAGAGNELVSALATLDALGKEG